LRPSVQKKSKPCVLRMEPRLQAYALPSLTTGYGSSRQAAEDLALMRAMPNMTVIDSCDALDTEQRAPAIAAHNALVWAHRLRGNVPAVLDEYDCQFERGNAKLLRDGAEVLIISSGIMTLRSLEVAKLLAADKVGVGVLHMPTIKPPDTETILHEARHTGRMVVVAGNHSVIGGLGDAVATMWLAAGVTPMYLQIALPNEFFSLRVRCPRCMTAMASRPT
jgi:transketolase